MSFKIKIDFDAFQDIEEAAEWYELQSKGLGTRYKNQVKKQINALKQNPYLFSIKYNNIHCRKIEKFPFLIHYQIEEEQQIINVFAVFHTSRNPKIWLRNDK